MKQSIVVLLLMLAIVGCAQLQPPLVHEKKPSGPIGPRWSDYEEFLLLKSGMSRLDVLELLGEPYMTVQGTKLDKGFVEVLLFKFRPKHYQIWKTTPTQPVAAQSPTAKAPTTQPLTREAKPTKDRQGNAWGSYMNCFVTFKDGLLTDWTVVDPELSGFASPISNQQPPPTK